MNSTPSFQTLPWPQPALAFLHDAARVLALAEQDVLQIDGQGRLRPRSLRLLTRTTCLDASQPGPHAKAETPSLSFLMHILQQAGLIGPAGASLHLSSTAYEWLAQPAELQLQALRQVWLLTPELSWCWLPASRGKAILDSSWRLLTLEGLRTIAGLPADSAVPVAAIESDFEAQGLLAGKGVSNNLPTVRQAMAQRARRLLTFLLCDLLPCLGLVDLLEIDDALCLSPTEEGIAWLTQALQRRSRWDDPAPAIPQELAAPAAELEFPCSAVPSISVDPELQVTVALCAAPADTFEIAHIAELLTPGPPAVYQVTRSSLQRAFAQGYAAGDIAFLLNRASQEDLPPEASAQLDRWQDELLCVYYEPGYKLTLAEPEILAALRERDPVRQTTLPLASGQEAWVSQTEAARLQSYLLRQGYTLAPASSQAGSIPLGRSFSAAPAGALLPAARHSFPLLALLALARTYQTMRRLAPGLAGLDVDELERQIAAALPAAALAGVERIVASNAAILEQVQLSETTPAETLHLPATPSPQPETGVVFDPPSPTGATTTAAAALDEAIASGAPVLMTYVDTRARLTSRRVRPLRLEIRHGQSYLVAFCELRQDERRFRVDRILSLVR